jgi:chemotaxis protein methyltransferase CheR
MSDPLPVTHGRDRAVDRAIGLVAALAGLRFDDENRDVLAAGLTRAGRDFPGGAAALVAAAAEGDERARALLFAAATVGETYFFRHPEHFELIRRIAPKLAHGGALHAWSAGCSTGEETWSLAFALRDVVVAPTVVGTDLNLAALIAARRGRYGRWSLRGAGLPAELGVVDGGLLDVPPPLRRLVRFTQLNLASDDWSTALGEGRFDLILCRNVLVYFSRDAASAVMRRLAARLVDGGLLVVSALDVELAPPTVTPTLIDGVTVLVRRDVTAPAESAPPPSERDHLRATPQPVRHAVDAARAAADRGDLTTALAAAEALVADTRSPETLHLYALVVGELGRAADAVALLQEAVALDDGYVLGHLGLGLADTLEPVARARHLDRALALVDGAPDDLILGGPDPLPASWVRKLASAARPGAR